jgi:hypothetical protein
VAFLAIGTALLAIFGFLVVKAKVSPVVPVAVTTATPVTKLPPAE